MKDKPFLGTRLEPAFSREFGVRAAERGLSKSALLKELALEYLAKQRAKKERKTAAA